MIFFLFPKLKIKQKGGRFETVSDIQRESQAVVDSIKKNRKMTSIDAFGACKKLWNPCIHSQGDYFEGDDSQN
jgi:hypothetical protein